MRNRIALALTVVLALGALLAGCGSDDETTSGSTAADASTTTTESTSTPDTTTTTITNAGTTVDGLSGTITVDAGQELTIALDSNPSTGYTWVQGTKPPPSILKYKGFDYEDAPEDAPPGTPQKMLLKFEAVGPGEADLTLDYVPPGGGDPEDTQSLSLIHI